MNTEQTQRKSNIVGLIALFLLPIPAGIVVSYLYISIANLTGNVYFHVLLSIAVGFVLFATINFLKKLFKITNNTGAVIAVALGLPLIHYAKWAFYIIFRIHNGELNPFLDAPVFLQDTWYLVTNYSISQFFNYIQELNEVGWALNLFGSEFAMQGAILWVVWVAELIIMAGFPIIAAATDPGVYLHSHNTWAKPRYLEYTFEVFNEEERTLIASGNMETILNKRVIQPNPNEYYSTVAACYAKDEPTDYIALYASKVDDKGKISHDVASKAINIGKDKIAELEAQLARKHAVMDATNDDATKVIETTPEISEGE